MAGFQQVNVLDEINFVDGAKARANVRGDMIPMQKIFDCAFEGTSSLYGWDEEEDNGCTIAHAAVDGGAETITASGTDDDCGELSHTAQWSPASNCWMMAKVKISQITTTGIAIGLVDQKENTNDHIAVEMSGAALRNASNTADAAVMIFDTDATTDVWYCATSNDGTEGTPVAATGSLAPVANTYFYVKVKTDTSGNVTFYYGTSIDRLTAVGYLPAAIAYASTNLLTPYVGFIARDTTAQVCTVSRIVVGQDN